MSWVERSTGSLRRVESLQTKTSKLRIFHETITNERACCARTHWDGSPTCAGAHTPSVFHRGGHQKPGLWPWKAIRQNNSPDLSTDNSTFARVAILAASSYPESSVAISTLRGSKISIAFERAIATSSAIAFGPAPEAHRAPVWCIRNWLCQKGAVKEPDGLDQWITSGGLEDLVEFRNGIPEDLRGDEQRLTHSYVLGPWPVKTNGTGGGIIGMSTGGNSDSGALGIKEMGPKGHSPRTSSMYRLREDFQWRIALEKVNEWRYDLRSTNNLHVLECAPNGIKSVRTFRWYLPHATGLEVCRFALGGMIFFWRIKRTFRKEERNAAASECLRSQKFIREIWLQAGWTHPIFPLTPYVKVVVPAEKFPGSSVRVGRVPELCA